MKTQRSIMCVAILAVLAVPATVGGQAPVSTAITYQGLIKDSGLPVDDVVDFAFRLYDGPASATQVGSTLTFDGQPGNPGPITVENGFVVAELDFGTGAFAGEARWLEIDVRIPHDPADTLPYTTLSPRLQLTASPYALHSKTAAEVTDGITGSGAAGCIPKRTGTRTLGDSIIHESGGRIGIGTTSPQALLANTDDDQSGATPNADGLVWNSAGVDYAAIINNSGDGSGLRIETNTNPARRILDLTNGVDYALVANGEARVCIGGTMHGSRFTVVNGGVAIGSGFGDIAAPNNGLIVQGYVGIGTSSPAFNLDVNGTTQTTGFRMPAGSASGRVLTSDASGVGTWQLPAGDIGGSGTTDYVAKFTGSKTVGNSLIKSSANHVGVGTTNPAFRFHVTGTQADDAILYLEAYWNPEIYFDKGGANADTKLHFTTGGFEEFNLVHDGSANELNFDRVGTGTILNISGNGRVGIMTANPAGTLDVNGTIYQRGGLLHADYVFDPDYCLESIEEHAWLMWTKMHLPAVAAACTDAEGREVVEIGDRQRGILEELEKAHVYIEQLHHRVRALEEQLAAQNRPPMSESSAPLAPSGERLAVWKGGDR